MGRFWQVFLANARDPTKAGQTPDEARHKHPTLRETNTDEEPGKCVGERTSMGVGFPGKYGSQKERSTRGLDSGLGGPRAS